MSSFAPSMTQRFVVSNMTASRVWDFWFNVTRADLCLVRTSHRLRGPIKEGENKEPGRVG